jgi:hypothetical protein
MQTLRVNGYDWGGRGGGRRADRPIDVEVFDRN